MTDAERMALSPDDPEYQMRSVIDREDTVTHY